MIVENLRKAGVQNTKRGERLVFEALDIHPGTWIHATGTYVEGEKTKRVAVSLGPEHGTVGPHQVKEAAEEAVQGLGHDTLVICGFAFDPHVSEEAKRYGALTVLPARMNPDLAMGDELLKKTGAGNLFMIFGEPDLDVKKGKDGKLTVEIRGVDVYDPTTGEVRSSNTDDVACWFPDTMYNGAVISASEFRERCLQLMDQVQRERTEIVITKHDKPVAKLVPAEAARKVDYFGALQHLGPVVWHVDPDRLPQDREGDEAWERRWSELLGSK